MMDGKLAVDRYENEGTAYAGGDFDIAIVGMAGRFPGAAGLEAFWQNLVDGVESIEEFDAAEAKAALVATGEDPAKVDDPHYVRRGGVLEGAELFDAAFFGVYPREAQIMDPQHRVFLELAWEALEHAGCDPSTFDGAIGVFAGSGMNTYLLYNLSRNREIRDNVQGYQLTIGNDKDFLPTRVAYKLNLRGPAINVQTACSTSLVATHLACQALLSFQCDAALAGGVTIHLPQRGGYLHQEGGIASPDGHCRAFDAAAAGTVGSNGAGVVVLKRLADALEQGDTIHAVIKATALNNDGANKVGYTAPSVEGQAAVIANAHSLAGIDPRTISYVEAHGTGTALGDPIEIAALTQAFRAGEDAGEPGDAQFCGIGSLKTNVGHLDAAAGVAGLIKTVLALEHRRIPPTLHFRTANPNIDFAATPFFVVDRLQEWPGPGPRRAGVSSFGIGGTNAHAVLEEPPPLPATGPSREWQLLTLSARTPAALDAAAARLADHLARSPQDGPAFADAAYTLATGRRPMGHRRTAVARDAGEAVAVLRGELPGAMSNAGDPAGRSVAFMFTGQGSQYAGMGAGLYDREPVFAAAVDRCAALLAPHLGLDLRALLFPARFGGPAADAASAGERLRQTAITQPALFTVEYALAQLLISWGIRPDAMIGHSIGEYVAAHLAGVLSLEDAVAVVAARGRLMGGLPPGAMLSLPLGEDETRGRLAGHDGLSVAAVNAAGTCVVAGPREAIDALRTDLAAQGIDARPLHTSHAFHSAMMDPILAAFTEVMRRVRLSPPRIPYVSNLTGAWITAEQATDPTYYGRHLRQAVRFGDGLSTLAAEPGRVLVEVGPGRTLATFARMHANLGQDRPAVTTLRRPDEAHDDQAFLLAALGQLWAAGIVPDWSAFYAGERRRKVPLPSYPFERQRYWVDASAGPAAESATPAKDADLDRWFFAPSWRRAPLGVVRGRPAANRLVLTSGSPREAELVRALAEAGARLTLCDGPASVAAALSALRAAGEWPAAIDILLPLVSPTDFAEAQRRGFDALLTVANAWNEAAGARPVRINVAGAGLFDVTGDEPLLPSYATLLGPARVIPQELPNIGVRLIDVVGGVPGAGIPAAGIPAAAIAAELASEDAAPVVALRGPHRWTPDWQPVPVNAAAGRARLRHRGVYVITGGLGRIGGVFAEHLARTQQARLALVDRTALPPRDAWDDPALEPRTAAAVARALALESLGADVLVLPADVADAGQLSAALGQVEARWGAVDGIVHAAGLVGPAAIRAAGETGPAERDAQFGAKVQGAAALDAAVADRPLDFVLLMSSISAVLGGLGFAAYAAANAFMDAFATAKARAGDRRWISAGWDGWLFAEELAFGRAAARAQEYAILPEEGASGFERLLSLPLPHVVVSTGDLPRRVAALAARRAPASAGPDAPSADTTVAGAAASTPASHPRPGLRTPYAAPGDPLEAGIAADWSHILGIAPIGVNDDFFELGGHSLLATQLVSRLRDAYRVDLPLRNLFESPTVAGLAAAIRAAQADAGAAAQVASTATVPALAGNAIPRLPAGADAPLSYGQQRLWFLDRLEPGSPLYNNFAALRIRGGALDVERFEASLNAVAARHEVLRTVFFDRDGIPGLRLLPEQRVVVQSVDLARAAGGNADALVLALAREEARKPFDLAAGPLLRATLLRLGDGEAVLFLTMHHIVSDGWSVGVLIREVLAAYRGEPLPELPIQYADYAAWQRAALAGEQRERELAFWRGRLGQGQAGVSALELPTDRPRPPVQTANGANVWFDLPGKVYRSLDALAKEEGATLFIVLAAGLQALLHRHSGQDDFAIGVPVANRDRSETAGLIGFLLNTLVLRARFAAEGAEGPAPVTFRDLVRAVKEEALAAFGRQDIPFEMLVEELQPPRDRGRSPFFQVMFDLQPEPLHELGLPGLAFERLRVDGGTAKFDLALSLEYGPESLGGFLNYNTDLFDRETAEALTAHFGVLLLAAAAAPDTAIGALPVMTAAERELVLRARGDAATEPREARTVVGMFEAMAAARPDQIACILAATPDAAAAPQLTYAQLNERANRIAHHLRGLGREDIVALVLGRSLDMIAGLLGVLKSGAAFLPIDPDAPAERIRYMLADAGAKAVLAHRSPALAGILAEGAAVPAWLDEVDGRPAALDPDLHDPGGWDNPQQTVGGADAAYVIYTSGSTGRPKGVIVEQRGLAQHIADVSERFGLSAADRVLQFASYTFDQAIEQVLTALTLGCTLVVRGPEVWPPADFPAVLAAYGLSSVNLPPAYWAQVLDELSASAAPLPAGQLKSIIIGGDVLSRESIALWQRTPAAAARLINAYGPTETTITAATFDVPPDWFERTTRPVPIGRPLPHRVACIVDRYGNPTPPGVPGELLLGGNGVARGYLNRPELTREKFVPAGAVRGEIPAPGVLYRTGDLARYRRDGNIEFLGRIDQQVKIRGFRIEPGEIEAVLREHPAVRDAAVLAQEDGSGNKTLVAYVEAAGEPPRPAALREHLLRKLPGYMAPSAFVRLEQLPRTAGGKVDRRSLAETRPAAEAAGAAPDAAFVAPRTPAESEIAAIWREVLRTPQVGVFDNFFELGGHSLLATQILSRLRQRYPVDVPLRLIFERPTVAGLAELVEEALLAQQSEDELAEMLAELDGLSDDEVRRLLASQGPGSRSEGAE